MKILSRWPLYPLLLAAYAVLFVYAANISEVLLEQLVEPLLLALGLGLAVFAVSALLFRDLRRGALLASAILLAVLFFGHAAFQLGGAGIPEEAQLVAWSVFIVAVGVYAVRARGSLATATAALNVFALLLVAMSLVTIVPAETTRAVRASEGEAITEQSVVEATRKPERDIYFLVFDRYGSDWSLKQAYGIENDLYPDLEAMGFQVIPGARANYHTSDLSLASTLNMRYLDDLTETLGRDSGDRTPARELMARHEVGTFLRQQGYRFYHIGAWWEPTRSSPIADEVLSLGKTAEFGSVLKGGTILPTLEKLAGREEPDTPSRAQHRDMALFAIRQVQHLGRTPGRKFVFAHILLPHPPYVLADKGRRVLKEEADSTSEAELFDQQLQYTNELMKRTVASLLDGPDETDPIIVLGADEGPYLCGDDDCVDGSPEQYGIRHGVLRAYYLPGLDYTVPADDSGVNIFRMLLREYFGADLPDLPNRSYTWPDKDSHLRFPGRHGHPAAAGRPGLPAPERAALDHHGRSQPGARGSRPRRPRPQPGARGRQRGACGQPGARGLMPGPARPGQPRVSERRRPQVPRATSTPA